MKCAVFSNHVLQLTEGMEVAGSMRWELVGCLALAWAIVCTVLIRGISSLGKVLPPSLHPLPQYYCSL